MEEFDKIKDSNNPEIINDFIIKLSESPNKKYLKYLKYLIDNLNPQVLDKVKLNLIFILGEIGILELLGEEYLNFLYEIYHRSDRWVRNECLITLEKISKKSKLNENVIFLIGNALNDDYTPIKINAMKVLLNFKQVPDFIFTNIFRVLNSKDSAVLEECRRVLKLLDISNLFGLLNQLDNYKILKSRAIRSLLIIQFRSILNLESFRELILGSNWDDNYKMNYFKEINTFQRIMAKNL